MKQVGLRLPATVASAAILTLLVIAFSAAWPGEADAQPRTSIEGNWATRGFGSIVQFRSCVGAPSDAMCGRIVWLWEPNDARGRPRVDNHNPDRSLRSRSLIGVEIVRGVRETAPGEWSDGELYNPDDGRTYTGTITLRGNTLELRGCALGVFCQTQVWRRPEDVLTAVRSLPR